MNKITRSASTVFGNRGMAALALAAVTAMGSLVVADEAAKTAPTTMPTATTMPAAAPEAGRSVKDVIADLQKNGMSSAMALQQLDWSDEAARTKAAETLIPAEYKQIALLDEYGKVNTKIKPDQVAQMKQEPQAALYALGDKPTVTEIDAAAATDDEKGVDAKVVRLNGQWMVASKDAAAQNRVTEDVIALDTAHPESRPLTMLTYQMSETTDSQAAGKKLKAALSDVLKNDTAKQIVAMQKAQAEAAAKLASLEGKPFVMTGKTVDGKDFSTADWKGKVILVDFWATWCGPCKAGLPDVIKTYGEFHDKGLEIVGVSNDYKADDLTKFIAKNSMPWPQLYNDAAGSKHKWNPITEGYGIMGIPTMFLIDKQGVLRTVKGREHVRDAMIGKMLAE